MISLPKVGMLLRLSSSLFKVSLALLPQFTTYAQFTARTIRYFPLNSIDLFSGDRTLKNRQMTNHYKGKKSYLRGMKEDDVINLYLGSYKIFSFHEQQQSLFA